MSRRFLVIHVVFHIACRGAVLQEELSEESEEPPAVAGPATPAATTPAATPAASPTGTGAVGALRGLGGLVAAAAHSAVHAVESAAHATEMLLGETHVAAAHKKEQEHAHHESALPNSLGFLECRCVWIACRESDENWPARFRSRWCNERSW